MVKLYGVRQSRASRCLWMLEELGIPYEHVPTHFHDDTKKAEYLEVNPNGRVPALVDGELKLFESLAINLYLARKYGGDGPLGLPTIESEALAVQWSLWAMTEVEPALYAYLMNGFVLPEAERDPAARDRGFEALRRPLAVLEGQLEKRPYLLGERFSVADLNVASVLSWAKMARLDLSPHPKLRTWLDACVKRPAALRAR